MTRRLPRLAGRMGLGLRCRRSAGRGPIHRAGLAHQQPASTFGKPIELPPMLALACAALAAGLGRCQIRREMSSGRSR